MTLIDVKKTTSESAIIALALKRLKGSNSILLDFIKDIKKGKHKQWNAYIQAKGEYKLKTHSGRLKPAPKQSLGSHNALIWYACSDKEKRGVNFIPQLKLDRCRTDAEKVSMIMNAEIPPEVKADLLSVIDLK